LCADELEGRLLPVEDEVGLRQGNGRASAAPAPGDPAAARHRIDPEEAHQGLQRAARRHRAIEHITVHETIDRKRTRSVEPEISQDRRDETVERSALDPAGDPVPGLPIGPVLPHAVEVGESRERTCVPGPDIDVCRIHHAPGIGWRFGIVFGREAALRRIEAREDRLKRAGLDEIVANAARKRRIG
jgi:hypothetical protein